MVKFSSSSSVNWSYTVSTSRYNSISIFISRRLCHSASVRLPCCCPHATVGLLWLLPSHYPPTTLRLPCCYPPTTVPLPCRYLVPLPSHYPPTTLFFGCYHFRWCPIKYYSSDFCGQLPSSGPPSVPGSFLSIARWFKLIFRFLSCFQ